MDIVYIVVILLIVVGGIFFRSFFSEAGKDGWKWVKSKFEHDKVRPLKKSESFPQEKILREEYVSAATAAWKSEGTAEHYLRSLDIPDEEKASIFVAACLRHKKREPKRNPFINENVT